MDSYDSTRKSVTEHTVVCEKHFSPTFIVRVDSVTRGDGSVLSVPRKIPKLTVDAYPSFFLTRRHIYLRCLQRSDKHLILVVRKLMFEMNCTFKTGCRMIRYVTSMDNLKSLIRILRITLTGLFLVHLNIFVYTVSR